MELTYRQILKKIQLSEACMPYLPEGMNMSPLCIGKQDGAVCDCFLSYRDHAGRSAGCRAIRWDRESDSVLACMDAGEISLEENSDTHGAGQYRELYPQVRAFAFSAALTAEQRGILRQFLSAGRSCCRPGVQEKLKASFPEFYIWCQPFLED